MKRHGVQYCSWKSNQHLDAGLRGETDLDLLVRRSQAGAFEEVASAHGFKRVLSPPWLSYPGIEDWLGLNEQSGRLLHLHVHYRLLLGRRYVKELWLAWEERLLAGAFQSEEQRVRMADPVIELLLLLVRVALKTPLSPLVSSVPVSPGLVEEFRYLRQRADEARLGQEALLLIHEQAVAPIRELAGSGDLQRKAALAELKRVVRRHLGAWRRIGPLGATLRSLAGRNWALTQRILRKLGLRHHYGKSLHSGGAIIAVIGPDGSGKSTVARDIQKWLGWKLDVRRIYLGSGDGSIGLFTRVKKSLGGKKGAGRSQAPAVGLKPAEAKGAIGRLRAAAAAFFRVQMAREKLKKMRQANRLRLQGCVLILDRLPQSQIIGINDGPVLASAPSSSIMRRRMAEKEKRLFAECDKIKPDVVIRLNIEAEDALRRKPDHNLELLQEKVRVSRSLKFAAPVLEVDAAQPLERVLLDVKKGLWAAI